MKKSVALLLALGLYLTTAVPSLQAQSAKGPPPPPQVWGPHLPGADPEDTNECVKRCNAEFAKELKKCLALEGTERAECEQPVREQHRACFTTCPR